VEGELLLPACYL